MGKSLCVFLLLCASLLCQAQFSAMTGVNVCKVRSSYLKNDRPAIGFQVGMSLGYHPVKTFKILSFEHELLINYKGYKQDLDKVYDLYYAYVSGSFLLKFKTGNVVHLKTGLELSQMVYASVEDRYDTFNKTDLGIVLGISFLESKPFSFYIRGTYGLLPMLDYYDIDAEGAFHGKIHDIRNNTLSLGFKFNIIHHD
jgi:hypothetical protein